MHILITNDDGVNAKGINSLVNLALKFGRVTVVAPDKCYSGMSHSINMNNPLFIEKLVDDTNLKVYSCTGSPVDCVKVAIDEILKDDPISLVLSGINHGSNANISVIYSGTMGAATEGALYGIPSIGFSLTDHDLNADFSEAIIYAEQIIKSVIEMPRKHGLCLNVNFPNIPSIKGIRVGRQTRGNWRESFVKHSDPRGRDYYWMSGAFENHEPNATDTDEYILSQGYASVVPVQMDLTDYQRMTSIKDALKL